MKKLIIAIIAAAVAAVAVISAFEIREVKQYDAAKAEWTEIFMENKQYFEYINEQLSSKQMPANLTIVDLSDYEPPGLTEITADEALYEALEAVHACGVDYITRTNAISGWYFVHKIETDSGLVYECGIHTLLEDNIPPREYINGTWYFRDQRYKPNRVYYKLFSEN